MQKYMAIDIGGTFVICRVVNENAQILLSNKEKIPQTLDGLLN